MDIQLIMENENTTMKIPKVLRDRLMKIKYGCNIDEMWQVVQLLYNLVDIEQLHSGIAREQLNEEAVGNQPDALEFIK